MSGKLLSYLATAKVLRSTSVVLSLVPLVLFRLKMGIYLTGVKLIKIASSITPVLSLIS